MKKTLFLISFLSGVVSITSAVILWTLSITDITDFVVGTTKNVIDKKLNERAAEDEL